MKFIVIFLLFLSGASYGQFKKLDEGPPKSGGYRKKTLKIEKKNHECVRLETKIFSTIQKSYPYSKSTNIELVSFAGYALPIENDSVCLSKLRERKVLTIPQIDSLTDVMYNYGFGGTILIIQEQACYEPRNAILFFDDTGRVFEYIEICFECEHAISSSEEVVFGELCTEKFKLVKRQFKNAGIIYGIVDNR